MQSTRGIAGLVIIVGWIKHNQPGVVDVITMIRLVMPPGGQLTLYDIHALTVFVVSCELLPVVRSGRKSRSVQRSLITSRSYIKYAFLPFALASLSFGINYFRLSITRWDRFSLTRMPRGFCMRAACEMASRSLHDSNFTTAVFGRPKSSMLPFYATVQFESRSPGLPAVLVLRRKFP